MISEIVAKALEQVIGGPLSGTSVVRKAIRIRLAADLLLNKKKRTKLRRVLDHGLRSTYSIVNPP